MSERHTMKIWHQWTLAVLFLGAMAMSVVWSATVSAPATASPQQAPSNQTRNVYATHDQEQQYLRLLAMDQRRLHRVVHLTRHVRQLQHKIAHLHSVIHKPVHRPVHNPAPISPTSSISTGIPTVWQALVQCEAGGNWHIDTGNGYYGGPQFSLGTYHSFHGVGMPQDQSPSYQLMIARRVLAAQGVGAWPVCGPRVGLARGD